MGRASPGKLIIISGPSGAGKSTVVRRLIETCPAPLVLSVSATTRPPRPGEQDGVDYHFLSPAEFARRRDRGEMLECFEVFGRGYWYGTPRREVSTSLAEGKWVVLEIDVDGAQAVLQEYPDALTLFVSPGSMEELERRLRGRGTESEETIRRRLEVARREMERSAAYRQLVVNDEVDRAVRQICDLLTKNETDSR
jgi:guanylate kinase